MQTVQIHRKLKTLALDQNKCVLYSADDVAKNITAYDLNQSKCASNIKCSNANPNRILINSKDSKHSRMYVTTKQGILLFFDISQA